jgi:hypothetical protein
MMKDIVDELRSTAKDVAHTDEVTAALLTNAAAEIERLRGAHTKSPQQQVAVSYSELVKDLKHHLRGEIDG